ncbi:MAG: hypothetical protein EGP70_05040, partial [Butyricicoccus sp.]|nr:hypothetical protein [Butyricicoccus sp.]
MAAIALWIITCFDNNGSYFTQKMVGVLCTVGTLCVMLFAGKDKVKRLMTPPAFALSAYMLLSAADYTGAKDGSVKLGYKLLPAFVADRIQDLTANGNVVQRGVYRQDAIKLWKTSPVFGRGLGGFENGVVSVQDYYYETKYAHNHYVEALCDL